MNFDKKILSLLERSTKALEKISYLNTSKDLVITSANGYLWNAESSKLIPIDKINSIDLNLLKGINHNLFSFKYILIECRDLEKMKIYLKKFGYDLVLDLKNYDYLFKKNI